MKKRHCYKIEIFQVPIGRRSKGTQTWRFRVRAPNGKVIAQGERYTSPAKIKRTLTRFIWAVKESRLEWISGVTKEK